MEKEILVCIDNEQNIEKICNNAIYCAKKLNTNLSFLHALEGLSVDKNDFSATLKANDIDKILKEFYEKEISYAEEKISINKDLLAKCQEICEKQGVKSNTLYLKADLKESILKLEKDYKLLILGHFNENDKSKHLLRILKATNIAIMLAGNKTNDIKKVLIAYNGDEKFIIALKKYLNTNLFKNLQIELAYIGHNLDMLNNGRKLFLEHNISVGVKELKDVQEFLNYSNNFDAIFMGAYRDFIFRNLFSTAISKEIITNYKKSIFILK